MRCGNKECGEELSPGDAFCSNCGTRTEIPTSRVCLCGATLQLGQKFCKKCGHKVEEPTSGVKQEREPALSLVCSGRNKDGSVCGYKLSAEFLLCPICGADVPHLRTQAIGSADRGKCSARRPDGSVCNADLPPGTSWCANCTAGDVSVGGSPVRKEKVCANSKVDGSICGNQLPEGAHVCQSCEQDGKRANAESARAIEPGSDDNGMGDAGDDQGHAGGDVPSSTARPVQEGPVLLSPQEPTADSTPSQRTDGVTSGGKGQNQIQPDATSIRATRKQDGSACGAGSDTTEVTTQKGNSPTPQSPTVHLAVKKEGKPASATPQEPGEAATWAASPETPASTSAAGSEVSASTVLKTPDGATPSVAQGQGDTAPRKPVGEAVCTAVTNEGSVCGAKLSNTGLSYCVACGKKTKNSDAAKQYFAQYAELKPVQKEINSASATSPNTSSDNPSDFLRQGHDPTNAATQRQDGKTNQDKKEVSSLEDSKSAQPGEDGCGKRAEKRAGVGKESSRSDHVETERDGAIHNTTQQDQDGGSNKTTEGQADGAAADEHPLGAGRSANGAADVGDEHADLESSVDNSDQSSQDNKRKKKRGGRNAVSITVNTPDLVTVVFHVIISDLGNVMDPEKYSVFMRFGPASLGTFQPDVDKHQMEYKEKTNLGYLYEGKVMMTKHQRNSNSFAYKYLVKKKEHGKSKVVWEVVQRRDPGQSYQQLVNRQFSIPLEKRSLTGVWHRYDGVAYLPGALSEGAFSKLRGMLGGSTYKDRVRQDALASARVYLPSVKDIQHSVLKTSPNTVIAENYLDRISQVMSSLRYQMLDPRLDYVDENMVEKAIRENIISPIMEQLKELSHQKKRTVALAMFVLLLVDRFSFLLAPPFVNDLCFYMLVKPDIMHKTCEDMEDLKVHFPDAMKDSRALAEKLCRLVLLSDRDAWKFGSNLSWLCCIPLLHFLLERSHPFQELKPSADFRSDQWWGVETCKERKDSFKHAYSYSHVRMSDEALQILQPAFASDPLFARTLVASLPLKPLLPILLTGLIPVEVMAATLAHHIHCTSYMTEDITEKVADCVVKMLSLWKEREASDRPLIQQLEKTECQATIVKELFRCLLGRTGYHPQTLLGVAHLLLMMLDTVAVIEEKENLKEKREAPCGWAERAQWVVSATQVEWIAHHYRLVHSDKRTRVSHLQMLGVMLENLKDIRHEGLRQMLEKLVADNFEKELSKLTDQKKLLVYLEQENVSPALVGMLNTLAFDSLDAAFELGSEQLSESQIVMLISLQSNFLEKKWREKVKNDADVLPFILTWTPMVNYFLRFREKKMSEKLSHIASHNIQYALKFLDDVTAQVRKGNIRISVLRMLIRYQQQFLDIVAATSKARDTVAVTLTQRAHELEAYESAASLLQTLVDFCCNFLQTDDLQHLQRSIQQQQDEAHLQCLSKVCDIANPDDIEDLADYHPRANPWQLTDDVLAVLPDFRDKTFSLVFHNIFSQRHITNPANRVRERPATGHTRPAQGQRRRATGRNWS